VIHNGVPRSDAGSVYVYQGHEPVNEAPIAGDDASVTNEDTPLTKSDSDLTANDFDSDPVAITSVFNAVGGTVERDQENGTVTFTPSTNFNGIAGFDYVVSDGSLEDIGHVTVTVTAVNDLPVATVDLNDTEPHTNDVLIATASVQDVDSSSVMLVYTWKVDGVVRQTTQTTALIDVFDLSLPGNGEKGQLITVEVTPNDCFGDGATAVDSATILNSAPIAVLSLNTVTPGKHDTLQASIAAQDPDGDVLIVTYVWRINGVIVQSATSTSLTSSLNLKAHKVKKDDVITLEASVSDGQLDGPLLTAMAIAHNGKK
jgi:hypothetical protein